MSTPTPRGTCHCRSRSTPGRIAAAIVMPRNTSAMTTFSFHKASAPATIAMTTSVATAARFAVSPIAPGFLPVSANPPTPVNALGEERIRVDDRRHGVVLVGSFLRAFALAGPGTFMLVVGWPATVVGAVLLAAAALVALRAVWRWDRTRVVLTTEKLFVVHGTLRRRAAAVRLTRVGPVEIEQSLLGRVLGYGTIFAGELEITHVPRPERLVDQLSA